MRTKFTQGEWTVEPHGNTHALYAGRDRDHHGLRLMNLDDGDRNFDANVKLITSAPKLFEALKSVQTFFEEWEEKDQESFNKFMNIDTHIAVEKAVKLLTE